MTPAAPPPPALTEPPGCCPPPFCCDISSYIGKQLSFSSIITSFSVGGSIDRTTKTATSAGLFSPGPNTFPVNVHEVYQTFAPAGAYPDYGGCFAVGAETGNSIYDYPDTATFGCDPAGFYYPGSPAFWAALYAESLLPNGGAPIGCYIDSGSSFITTAAVTYSSSCFGLSVSKQSCTRYYFGVLDCSGTAVMFAWTDFSYSISIV